MSNICCKLRQVRRVCKNGSDAALSTIVKALSKAVKARVGALEQTLFEKASDLKDTLVEAQAAGDTMCGRLEVMKCQETAQKPQRSNVMMVGKRMKVETLKMKGGF